MKFSKNHAKNALISRLQQTAQEFDAIAQEFASIGGRFLVIHGRCTKTPYSNVFGNSPEYWSQQMERAADSGNLDDCTKVVRQRKSEVLALQTHALAMQNLRALLQGKERELQAIISEAVQHLSDLTPAELGTDLVAAVELLNGDWKCLGDDGNYKITAPELQHEAENTVAEAFNSLAALLYALPEPKPYVGGFDDLSAFGRLYTIEKPAVSSDHVPMCEFADDIAKLENHHNVRSLPPMAARLQELVDEALKITSRFQEEECGYVNEAEFARFSQRALRGEVTAAEYATRLKKQRQLRMRYESARERLKMAICMAAEQCASLIVYLKAAAREIDYTNKSHGSMRWNDQAARQMAMASCLAADVVIRRCQSDLAFYVTVFNRDLTLGAGKEALQHQIAEIKKQFGSKA